jgi:AcrR family transcriptional regulator
MVDVQQETSSEGYWVSQMAEVRPQLSRDAVVETAHRLVHEGGMDSFTVRALAQELDVGTSAIYRRIERKELLLVAIADLVLSEVQTDDLPRRRTWSAALRLLGVRIRGVLREHPHAHSILDSHLLATPESVRIADAAMEQFARSSIRGSRRVDAYNAWAGYVFGFSVMEFLAEPSEDDRTHVSTWLKSFVGVDPANERPHVQAARRSMLNHAIGMRWEGTALGPYGKSFEVGLDALLQGLGGVSQDR